MTHQNHTHALGLMREWMRAIDPFSNLSEPDLDGSITTFEHGQAIAIDKLHELPAKSPALLFRPQKFHELTVILPEPNETAFAELINQWLDHTKGEAIRLWLPTAVRFAPRILMQHGFWPTSTTSIKRITDSDEQVATPDGFTIRPIESTDHEQVLTQALHVMDADYDAKCCLKPDGYREMYSAFVDELMTFPNGSAIVAADQTGQIVGFASLYSQSESTDIAALTSSESVRYFGFLGVDPKHRGQGLGGALAHTLHREAARTDTELVAVHNATMNPLSKPFFMRAGYRPVGQNWMLYNQ